MVIITLLLLLVGYTAFIADGVIGVYRWVSTREERRKARNIQVLRQIMKDLQDDYDRETTGS